MPTQHEEIFAALAAPFAEGEVKTRQQGGRTLSYITARVAANRLDEVLGCENYRQEYRETRNGLICRIWYRLAPDQEWNWKEDGGAAAGMPEADNNEKSSFSDAFKRAAAMLGVARYLYRDGIPHYGEVAETPVNRPATPHPSRPMAEPRPGGKRQQEQDARRQQFADNPPATGRQLFSWVRRQEEQYGKGLLQMVNDWGRGNRLDPKMINWPDSAAVMAYEYALQMLPADGVTSDEQRHYEEALAN